MFVLGGICPATCEISSGTKWISKTDLFFYVLLFSATFPKGNIITCSLGAFACVKVFAKTLSVALTLYLTVPSGEK